MGHNIVHVKVNNRTAVLVRPYPYESLLKHWSYSVSSYVYMSKPWYRKCKYCGAPRQAEHRHHVYEPVWDGKIKLLKRDRVPSGLFWATYKEIEKAEGIRFKIHTDIGKVELNDNEDKWVWSEGKYEFQNDCVDEIVYNLSQVGRGGLILNATGSGKTRIFAMLASRLDCDLLFIVDQLDLLEQARKDIGNHLGEKIGKVGESEFKLEQVTVATRQTLHIHRKDKKFLKWFQRVEVICIDEIHEQMNKSNFDVISIAKPLATIGLTATLGLTKKDVRLRAFSLCGPKLYEYPITKGMEDNVLSTGIGMSFMYTNVIGDIDGYTANEAYEEKIVSNSERNWIVASLVKRAHKLGKYTIVLVERIKHLEKLSRRLKDIPHHVVSGTFKGKGISVSTRMKSKDKFEKGKIRVILANKVFKKGVDIKRVDCIINAAGRKSKNDAIQIFGRGVRTHNEKSGLIYIDITDTSDTPNWFSKAGKSRIRALKGIGITIKKFTYKDEDDIKLLFTRADKYLKEEVTK